MKLIRKFKRKSFYQKSLISFTAILGILGVVFLSYVWSSMVVYERNLVDNYIKYLAESGKLTESIDEDLFEISEYEKKNAKISDGVKKLLKSDDLKISKNSKLSDDKIFAYDLKLNDKLISTVSLKSTNSYTRMAILKVDEWEVVEVTDYFEKGLYNYEITVPVNYKVYINNQELSKDYISSEGDIEGLERLTKHIEISKSKTYAVNYLVYNATIKIVDENNKEQDYKLDGNKIVLGANFKFFLK